jgi:hypothetical protein
MTTVIVLRLRYKLTLRGRRERLLLAEEAGALAWDFHSSEIQLKAEAARILLEQPASGDLALVARQRLLAQAIARITSDYEASIAAYARERAAALAADHARVRAAAAGSVRVNVEPVLPPDVIGLYVLVPSVR